MGVTSRYDDLDGTEGARTVTFALEGQAFEIDLAPENRTAFTSMLRPYLSKARSVGVALCIPATPQQAAVLAALTEQAEVLTRPAVATAAHGGRASYTEEKSSARPALQIATGVPHQAEQSAPLQAARTTPADKAPPPAPQTAGATATEVRAWAKRWSIPNVPLRGRIPGHIREVYDAFHDENRGPWETLLKEHNIDPREAETNARALAIVDDRKEKSQEELDRDDAKRAGKLSGAQLTLLRKMFSAKRGRATCNDKSIQTTSFEALRSRGLCALADSNERTRTYEISNPGRLWFAVHGIDPASS